jgi:hypothetical protein
MSTGTTNCSSLQKSPIFLTACVPVSSKNSHIIPHRIEVYLTELKFGRKKKKRGLERVKLFKSFHQKS